MPRRRLVLASASPARLRIMIGAGLDPEVVVSGVDETDVAAADTSSLVLALAERKAAAVAPVVGDAIIVAADSLLDIDGVGWGKPTSAHAAVEQWHRMCGQEGALLTGHCVIDGATGARVSDVDRTVVRFGRPSDVEIDAYVASGEPMNVAGGFTLDGRSGPFVDGINGNAGNVLGLSLPTLRDLLGRLGVRIIDLWC